MNYSKLADTIDPKVQAAVDEIMNPEIDPEIRQFNLEILLREVGDKVYEVIYAMNAYDMEIEFTTGSGITDSYYGMAKNLSDSISLGDKNQTKALLDLWIEEQILKAQKDAYDMAGEFGKYRVATRTEPANCCPWCRAHVGTFVEPTSEVFRKHANCRGVIETSGWKSYNGKLKGKNWREYVE